MTYALIVFLLLCAALFVFLRSMWRAFWARIVSDLVDPFHLHIAVNNPDIRTRDDFHDTMSRAFNQFAARVEEGTRMATDEDQQAIMGMLQSGSERVMQERRSMRAEIKFRHKFEKSIGEMK